MKLGEPLPVRQKHIEELQKVPGQKPWPFKFRNRVEHYPQYSVPLGFPKYRLSNGRTLAAQQEYLVTHPNVRQDLFSADPESEEAQRQQHALLENMVNEAGLLSYFKTNRQEEPLILDSRGYVVNGNRRLCAMRMLHEDEATKYSHFKNVDVIFLPPATEKEIYELEVELQVKPDIHMRYNWLREAMMMRIGRLIHTYSDEDLARIHDHKPKEVREKIQLLDYADKYLEERGFPQQYHRVQRAEFALKKLRDSKDKLPTESDKVVFEKLAYVLLDDPEGKGRLYQAIPDVFEAYPKIIEAIKREIPMAAVQPSTGSVFLGKAKPDQTALIKTVSDPSKRDALREVIIDVVQSEAVRRQDSKAATFSLKRVQEAHTNLVDAVGALTSTSSTEGIESHLDAIAELVRKIRERVNKHA